MMKLANDLILEQGHRELPRVRVRPAAFLEIGALVDIAGHGASRANGVRWRAAAIEAVRALNDRGYYVFVLGGGDCALDPEIEARLALEGAHVDRFYGADRQSDSSALDQAMSEWPIVSERSFLVGRPGRQSEAAERVGVAAHAFDGGDLAGLVRAASAKE
jgi:D-glycero-D-manno-heptose 1,7-bisphosphate phosphatase